MADDGSITDLFASLAGQEIPGGCSECSAYQTVREEVPRIFRLLIHHDNDCPVLRAAKAGTN
jgi:hypothetical protein